VFGAVYLGIIAMVSRNFNGNFQLFDAYWTRQKTCFEPDDFLVHSFMQSELKYRHGRDIVNKIY
jgi:hypothetical protein